MAPDDTLVHLSESALDALVLGHLTDESPLPFVRSIRDGYPNVPIVAVVTPASPDATSLLEAGATDVVSAPPATTDREAFRDGEGDDQPPPTLPDGDSAGDPSPELADWCRVLLTRVTNAVGRHESDQRARRDRSDGLAVEGHGLLDAIFERVPIHMYVKDTEGRHMKVSQAYLRDPSDLLGRRDNEIDAIEHGELAHRDDMQIIEQGTPILNKEECIEEVNSDIFSADFLHELYPDAEMPGEDYESWVLTSKVPWVDDEGTVVGLVGVTQDISERKHYQKQLERQNERLDRFASIVSHDLRNPLNVATGYLELARADCDSEHLDRVERAHERMNELIADLLRLARNGLSVDDPESVAVGDVARDAWELGDWRSAEVHLEDGLPTVEADPGRLQELFQNLFDNAVSHAGPSTTVRVGALDGAGFYVADDGPGISPDELDDVFESGYTTDSDGTGFGLAIVKTIAEAHDWSVRATNETPEGARFEFRT
jgi:signal transduction histidine kinase